MTRPSETIRRTWTSKALGPLRGRGATSPSGVTGLPVLPPWVAVAELALFVLVVACVEWWFPQFDLASIQPNPCWLPVLLLSLQYGTVSGLLAASIAIALTVIGGFPEQDVEENHFAYLLRIWGQPLLWVAAAVLLGQFRNRQISAKLELRRRVEQLESQRAAISSHAENLRRRCDTLERRIASRPEPLVVGALSQLAAIANAPTDAPIEDLFSTAIDAVLPGAGATLHIRDGGVFVCIAATGANAAAKVSSRFTSTPRLVEAINAGMQSFSVFTATGEALLAGSGLAAAAVRHPRTSELIGLVRIDTMDAGQLGTATAAALEPIAAAFAPIVAGDRQIGDGLRTASLPGAAPQQIQARGWRRFKWLQSTSSSQSSDSAREQPVKSQASG